MRCERNHNFPMQIYQLQICIKMLNHCLQFVVSKDNRSIVAEWHSLLGFRLIYRGGKGQRVVVLHCPLTIDCHVTVFFFRNRRKLRNTVFQSHSIGRRDTKLNSSFYTNFNVTPMKVLPVFSECSPNIEHTFGENGLSRVVGVRREVEHVEQFISVSHTWSMQFDFVF